MMPSVADVTFLVILFFQICYNLQVVPERARAVYVNPKYADNGTFYIKRYGRNSPYYINIEGYLKYGWADNVSTHFYFYEFLHNEYKRSFVEMHFKFCELVNKEPYIGGALAKLGVICPAPKGWWRVRNITILGENFPNVWPFEKCRVEVHIVQNIANEMIAKLEVYAVFKQKIKG